MMAYNKLRRGIKTLDKRLKHYLSKHILPPQSQGQNPKNIPLKNPSNPNS